MEEMGDGRGGRGERWGEGRGRVSTEGERGREEGGNGVRGSERGERNIGKEEEAVYYIADILRGGG